MFSIAVSIVVINNVTSVFKIIETKEVTAVLLMVFQARNSFIRLSASRMPPGSLQYALHFLRDTTREHRKAGF